MLVLNNILSIDFETIPDKNVYHIGAVFKNKIFERKNITNIKTALRDLSQFSKDADYILGHNIINHDLPVAKDILPEANFLTLPVIDTLFLSPLAFPENPYHKLVKDYKLVKNSKNDPIADGRMLQKEIIDSNLSGNPLLGILPTGGGKSICYQIPALHRYDRLGELTIVISPLKALMKDQVDNLNRVTGTQTAAQFQCGRIDQIKGCGKLGF